MVWLFAPLHWVLQGLGVHRLGGETTWSPSTMPRAAGERVRPTLDEEAQGIVLSRTQQSYASPSRRPQAIECILGCLRMTRRWGVGVLCPTENLAGLVENRGI